ncbi:hypothetical protein PV327_011100 [Microctonus hyperodae]|uniref:CIDE-N domain-containing protein n=1 Tax=Microctonus hyperodae TaxID=165561 RepID=A0AA39C7V5_MICHY|nr:hypothetical protein PV327_011100 [Microctonus hyperodae]
MAASFKIVRHDKHTERKAITAASINELITIAKMKLKLSGENYKLYTDDFTEIDKDEILMELAKARGTDQLLLTIVPEEVPWNTDVLCESTPTLSIGSHEEKVTKVTSSSYGVDMNSSSASHTSDHLSRIVPKLATNIQIILQKGSLLSHRNRRKIVHVVRDYLINDLEDTSLGTCHRVSEQIVTTYQKTFTSKITTENVGGEIESLRQAIYYSMHYLKNQPGTGSQCTDCFDHDDIFSEKSKVQDEYGCVAYMPVRPSPDVQASMENNRLKLINIFNSTDEDVNDNIINTMDECYYLQRKDIYKEKNLSIVFERWPYFHHHQSILKHSNQLLGKDLSSIWRSSMNKLYKPINRWMKNEEIACKVNKAKERVRQPDEMKKYVRETLKTVQKYSDISENDEPYHIVTFGFIVKFMNENLNFLYVLTNEEFTDDELIEQVPVPNPVLMIRGKNVHYGENEYDVVINKKIIIHAASFTEGILITFLCYYVFGLVYPPQIEGTLEAIQRSSSGN